MGQEFIIKSQTLEDKVNQLLPSQGGFQAGVDLSASTTIIPIVDLTESAEGSNLRLDLQTALSLNSSTAFDFYNSTVTIANNTGYFRIFGTFSVIADSSSNIDGKIQLTDGTTTKTILRYFIFDSSNGQAKVFPFDFIVFLEAGQSIQGVTDSTSAILVGVSRQIATITGELVNP